jgi:hypothetical protein
MSDQGRLSHGGTSTSHERSGRTPDPIAGHLGAAGDDLMADTPDAEERLAAIQRCHDEVNAAILTGDRAALERAQAERRRLWGL